MSVRRHELEGIPWFSVARRFESGAQAERVYTELLREGRRNKGKLDLGVYRVKLDGETEADVIALVSLQEKGITWAANAIGGETWDFADNILLALLARRVNVVEEIRDAGKFEHGGTLRIKHGLGAYLHRDGSMSERVGRDE